MTDAAAAVRARAHAKLTLSLRVLGRRPDGYHELEALVASLTSPADEVAVALRDPGGVGIGVIGPASEGVPTDSSNIAVQAAALVLRRASEPHGLAVAIHKGIPAEAGLGGGSADAAAVIRALEGLVPGAPAGADAMALAAEVGSDVPACLTGGLLRMSGRGERVDRLEPIHGWAVVIAVPETRLSTAAVYRAWSELAPDHELRVVEPPPALRGVTDVLVNELEPAALLVEPGLAGFRDAFREATGIEPLLAGSGSAYVAVVDGAIGPEVMAAAVADGLEAAGHAPRLVAVGEPATQGVELLEGG